jgi:hypothetical protein
MFSYASEICIEKAQSFQGSAFDADILSSARRAAHAKPANWSASFGAN